MKSQDAQQFGESWDTIALAYEKTLHPDVKEIYFRLLRQYSLSQVQAGLQAHMSDPERGRFMPKPADVIGKIQAVSLVGFPGPDEAWARFPRDENDSGCICDEMVKAWGVACDLEPISGRMAFKEAYSREVAMSKAKGRGPSWYITTGVDKAHREQITLDAVRDGMLTASAAQTYLPHIPIEDLEKLAENKVTASNLLENHAQTVNSLDQLLLDSPVADSDVAKTHLSDMLNILGKAS